ncbi:MAG TPA: ArsR family transcriptional regulator [Phycisphaerales bacterium]|nr:ArsR family transcriptional regulator [Phycisphaerales bacterium]
MENTTTKTELLCMEALEQAAGCLRTVAHPHRLRMIQMLLGGTYSVGELADACNIPPSGASEHLGKMRDRGLLNGRREGRVIYYEIAESGLSSIMNCIEKRFGG